MYFGEILGKHSEVYGELSEGDFELKTNDQEFIEKFEDIFRENYSQGYNPLEYLSEEDENEEDEE